MLEKVARANMAITLLQGRSDQCYCVEKTFILSFHHEVIVPSQLKKRNPANPSSTGIIPKISHPIVNSHVVAGIPNYVCETQKHLKHPHREVKVEWIESNRDVGEILLERDLIYFPQLEQEQSEPQLPLEDVSSVSQVGGGKEG